MLGFKEHFLRKQNSESKKIKSLFGVCVGGIRNIPCVMTQSTA